MDSHSAVVAMQEGCLRLQLPESTAKELIRYLLVKQLNGQRAQTLSPSRKLDELQHWVLLNTKVRKAVEALVGEIDHSTSTADLPDEQKAGRRQASSLELHPTTSQVFKMVKQSTLKGAKS